MGDALLTFKRTDWVHRAANNRRCLAQRTIVVGAGQAAGVVPWQRLRRGVARKLGRRAFIW